MNNFALVFLVLEILMMGGFILSSFINYNTRFGMTYDLRNHFPYELNYESKFKDNLMGNVLLLVATGCGVAFYILFDNNKQNGYFLFMMIAGCIHQLVHFFLAFVPLKLTKSHLLLVTLDIILSFLIPFSLAISSSITFNHTHDYSLIIFIALPAVICLFVFILMMNPKLTRWSRMEEIKNEDGTTSYKRPRYFILAFYEWLLLFASLLTQIIVILSALIIK